MLNDLPNINVKKDSDYLWDACNENHYKMLIDICKNHKVEDQDDRNFWHRKMVKNITEMYQKGVQI